MCFGKWKTVYPVRASKRMRAIYNDPNADIFVSPISKMYKIVCVYVLLFCAISSLHARTQTHAYI